MLMRKVLFPFQFAYVALVAVWLLATGRLTDCTRGEKRDRRLARRLREEARNG